VKLLKNKPYQGPDRLVDNGPPLRRNLTSQALLSRLPQLLPETLHPVVQVEAPQLTSQQTESMTIPVNS